MVPFRLVFTNSGCPNHRAVASILRFSTALEFTSLRATASNILQNFWKPDISGTVDEQGRHYAADTVLLAKECDLPIILKRAYYELLMDPDFQQSVDEGDEASSSFPLPSEELYRLSSARAKMLKMWAEATIKFPDTWKNCATSGYKPCLPLSKRHAAWFNAVCKSGIAQSGMRDPVYGFKKLENADWKEEGMCVQCVRKMCSEWQKQQADMWTKLDMWLDLNVVQ